MNKLKLIIIVIWIVLELYGRKMDKDLDKQIKELSERMFDEGYDI